MTQPYFCKNFKRKKKEEKIQMINNKLMKQEKVKMKDKAKNR